MYFDTQSRIGYTFNILYKIIPSIRIHISHISKWHTSITSTTLVVRAYHFNFFLSIQIERYTCSTEVNGWVYFCLFDNDAVKKMIMNGINRSVSFKCFLIKCVRSQLWGDLGLSPFSFSAILIRSNFIFPINVFGTSPILIKEQEII